MAKTQTSATLSPYALAMGNGIYEEDAQAVVEMLNHAYGYNPNTHVCVISGGQSWDGNSGTAGENDPATHDVEFPTASGWTETYRFSIWIDPDDVTLTVEATCAFNAVSGTNNGEVRFSVGGASGGSAITLNSFTANTESTDSDTVAVSVTGTGVQLVIVEINRTSTGSPSADQELKAIRIETNEITSSLPDPPAE